MIPLWEETQYLESTMIPAIKDQVRDIWHHIFEGYVSRRYLKREWVTNEVGYDFNSVRGLTRPTPPYRFTIPCDYPCFNRCCIDDHPSFPSVKSIYELRDRLDRDEAIGERPGKYWLWPDDLRDRMSKPVFCLKSRCLSK